jgi:threonine/homoserine/homoserine lactone efflux protein
MNSGLWWFFVTTCLVAALTPGPAVMLVVSNGLKYGPRRTVAAICGILSSNALYFAISGTSLGALLLSSYNLFFLVKWVGAGYLIYLGIRALLSGGTTLGLPQGGAVAERSVVRLYVDGCLLQISNPKALLWFGAILPQFIDTRRAIAPQIVLLGLTSILLEFPILVGYGMLAGRAARLEPRYAAWTNRISGLFLLGAGGGLAMVRRD